MSPRLAPWRDPSLPAGVRVALYDRAHPPSMLDELCEMLMRSEARVTFDRGASMTRPCTFCSSPAPTAGHELVYLGSYANGDPLRRPVCTRCMPSAEARGGGAPLMRAFIGNPADAAGNALTCDYCDRMAVWRVGPEGKTELLCARHTAGGGLKPDAQREARAAADTRGRAG